MKSRHGWGGLRRLSVFPEAVYDRGRSAWREDCVCREQTMAMHMIGTADPSDDATF